MKPDDIEAVEDERYTNGIYLHSKKHCITVDENIPYLNWFEWQIDNWGTKWNACEPNWEENSIYFQTAWSFPEPIIEALSKKFPEADISFRYSDEDVYGLNHDSGYAKNGAVSFDNLSGRELLELIIDIQGDFYYIGEDGELHCEE